MDRGKESCPTNQNRTHFRRGAHPIRAMPTKLTLSSDFVYFCLFYSDSPHTHTHTHPYHTNFVDIMLISCSFPSPVSSWSSAPTKADIHWSSAGGSMPVHAPLQSPSCCAPLQKKGYSSPSTHSSRTDLLAYFHGAFKHTRILVPRFLFAQCARHSQLPPRRIR